MGNGERDELATRLNVSRRAAQDPMPQIEEPVREVRDADTIDGVKQGGV
jgi:hypothetical protein